MKRSLLFVAFVFALAAANFSKAQSPTPMILQAAAPVTTARTVTAATPTPVTAATGPTMLQTLQEMQAANAETLKKQEAALQTLDELQKAAEEIKIFSKRG